MLLSHMLRPAFLMDIDSTSSTVVDMDSSFFATNETVHCLPPEIIFINLTPFIPLSLKRRGGRDFREGLRPSLTYTPPSLAKGRGPGG